MLYCNAFWAVHLYGKKSCKECPKCEECEECLLTPDQAVVLLTCGRLYIHPDGSFVVECYEPEHDAE